MDQRNYRFQGINFHPNEMYPNNENSSKFLQRASLGSNNLNSSIPSHSRTVFEPPYTTHHVAGDNIRTIEPFPQREQRSPFFHETNFPWLDNRSNNSLSSNNNTHSNVFQNSNSIYKPKPFINQNLNPYGSINSFHSYALNNMSTILAPNEPDIQVINVEQCESNVANNMHKNFNRNSKQQIQTTLDSHFHRNNETTKSDMIIESTEKLQIENYDLSNKTNLKRKLIDTQTVSTVEEIDESNSKRQRLQTMRILTGSIEKIIYWHKIMPYHEFSLFETIGPCINIINGLNKFEKRLLLRAERGPVLQVSYYETEIPLNDEQIQVGKYIYCVGRMVSSNRLIALKISEIALDKSCMQTYLHRIAFKLENIVNRITYQTN